MDCNIVIALNKDVWARTIPNTPSVIEWDFETPLKSGFLSLREGRHGQRVKGKLVIDQVFIDIIT